MKKTKALVAISTAIAILFAPSLFADKRHRDTTDRGRDGRYDTRRVTLDGRIRDIDRDRNGFVIRLDDERYALFAPVQTRVNSTMSQRRAATRVRNLERGDYIRATGTMNSRGYVTVHSITLLRSEDRRHDRNDAMIAGVVERVDQRGRIIWIEEARSRRVIAVDVRNVDRNRRDYDVDDVRRGDRITVRGDWTRNGRFDAERVEIDRGVWR
jgi:hypothetical protein